MWARSASRSVGSRKRRVGGGGTVRVQKLDIAAADHMTRGRQRRAGHGAFQFADVAGPRIGLELRDGFRREHLGVEW